MITNYMKYLLIVCLVLILPCTSFALNITKRKANVDFKTYSLNFPLEHVYYSPDMKSWKRRKISRIKQMVVFINKQYSVYIKVEKKKINKIKFDTTIELSEEEKATVYFNNFERLLPEFDFKEMVYTPDVKSVYRDSINNKMYFVASFKTFLNNHLVKGFHYLLLPESKPYDFYVVASFFSGSSMYEGIKEEEIFGFDVFKKILSSISIKKN